ncbi:hypothetical protein DMENIID0001_137110 [Sergentomyia squamirostris]
MPDYSDLLDLSFNFSFIMVFFECFMIYLSINILNRSGMLKLLAYFDELVEEKNTDMSVLQRSSLTKNLKWALIFSKCFIAFVTGMGVTVNLYDLQHTAWTSPMLFLIPGISPGSIFFYPTNIIFQVFLYIATVGMVVISATAILIIIMYIQAELRAIGNLLRQLDDEEVILVQGSKIIRIAHEEHKDAIDNFQEATKFLWHSYFYKLFSNMMYICFTFFIFKDIDMTFIVAGWVVASCLFLVCLLCFFGQMLGDDSEAMASALYMSKWYLMSVKDQKNLLILMIRFNRPFLVKTFGFGTISVNTIVQICKAAVYYAAILYTLFD